MIFDNSVDSLCQALFVYTAVDLIEFRHIIHYRIEICELVIDHVNLPYSCGNSFFSCFGFIKSIIGSASSEQFFCNILRCLKTINVIYNKSVYACYDSQAHTLDRRTAEHNKVVVDTHTILINPQHFGKSITQFLFRFIARSFIFCLK